MPPYPLFREPQYLLALTNTIARVAEEQRLDIVHAHYAVPHATAAYLARAMLASAASGVPRTVTTLHGTDITLVGSDPSYRRVVAFSIERSDGVTAVSRSLEADTVAALGVRHPIRVIPNFLDCAEYRRRPDPALRARLCPEDRCDALVIHVSNFRPVKRVDVALEVFRLIRRRVRARFLLVGDGPVRADIERRVAEYGSTGEVTFAGEQEDLVAYLSVADVFLLPSAAGKLRARRARSHGVRSAGRRVEGRWSAGDHRGRRHRVRLPAAGRGRHGGTRRSRSSPIPARRASIARQAAEMVRTRYCTERIVPLYEAEYFDVLGERHVAEPSASVAPRSGAKRRCP